MFDRNGESDVHAASHVARTQIAMVSERRANNRGSSTFAWRFASSTAREMRTGVASKHLTFELAEKSATGKVERRRLSLFVAAMGPLAIFAPARRLLR